MGWTHPDKNREERTASSGQADIRIEQVFVQVRVGE